MTSVASHGAANRLADDTVDEAIRWTVTLECGDPSARTLRAFEQWRDADPSHRAAWDRVQSMDASLAPPGNARVLASRALRSTASLRRGRRNVLAMLLGGGVVGAAGWKASAHLPWQNVMADASTRIGEQRRLGLPDGSWLTLNTNTAVSWRFTPEARRVTLHRGEILLETQAPPVQNGLAFSVQTRDGSVRALAARFGARLFDDATAVRVTRGEVDLLPLHSAQAVTTQAGQAWRMTRDAAIQSSADTAADQGDAWVDGIIDARNMRLADLLADLARYRVGRIDCDPRIADLRVSGMYQLRDADATLQFLADSLSLQKRQTTRWWIRFGPRDDASA